MKDRDWPKPLECSRYRDILSGLYTILGMARSADEYIGGIGARSASSASADLLRLTMKQATAELEKSEGTLKPIFIKRDITVAKDLKTIGEYLEFVRQYLSEVTVQDPSRRRDTASGVQWLANEAISRFKAGSKPPEEQPPINLLDLDCIESNVVPECFNAEAMKFLSKLKAGARRPTKNLTSLWTKVEEWRLLSQKGSGTMTHQDHCGFWTWVMVEEGKKLWLICQMSGDDRKRFAEEGVAFTGGRWIYVWLMPGDILIIPPGTVHVVFTPVDTLCVGGNAWSQKRMGDTMRYMAFEKAHPNVTNDDEVVQLPELLEKVSRLINSTASIAKFGGKEQMEMFTHYYKVRNLKNIRLSTLLMQCRNISKFPKGRKQRAKFVLRRDIPVNARSVLHQQVMYLRQARRRPGVKGRVSLDVSPKHISKNRPI
jgi:hypothetical protein